MVYRAYISRNFTEYEVSAELYDEGTRIIDTWQDTGTCYIVDENPVFYKFVATDDFGIEFDITEEEMAEVIEQMQTQYWDS
jgi:hypothetical protein